VGSGFSRTYSRAKRAIERQQIEERHQRLGSLCDVVHGFAVERMHDPQQCDGECQVGRPMAERRRYARQVERSPDEPEQHEAAQEMDRDVGDVVSRDVQAADRVVDRERQVDERPSGGR